MLLIYSWVWGHPLKCVFVWYCSDKTQVKSNLGKKKVYITLYFIVYHQEKPVQKLKADAWKRNHGGREMLLIGWFSYATLDQQPTGDNAHSGLGLSHISKSRRWPIDTPIGQCDVGNSSAEILSSWMTLDPVKLTQTNEHSKAMGLTWPTTLKWVTQS